MTNRTARLAAVALICGVVAGAAQAQETFSAGSGAGNTSNRTGTQGVAGNPQCAPPVEIVNGRRVTPKNWSCDSSGYWASRAPGIKPPSGPPHPGPAYAPGAANPCQPGGPGGYNWLDNPSRVPLPPGCTRRGQRSATFAKPDSNYEAAPPGSFLEPPTGPPGSYIVPADGPPGSYLQPDGRPGSYVDSTAASGPGTGTAGTRSEPRGTAQSARPHPAVSNGPGRQDTQAMLDMASDSPPAYRQDTAAMQGGLEGGGRVAGQAAPTPPASKPAPDDKAATSRAGRIVNAIVNLFGDGP